MTSAHLNTQKFFYNKKFYLYLKRSCTRKAAELIKLFGGQIEQFLDHEIAYVLTDIPKCDWPPNGTDNVLVRARNHNVKLMSQEDLLNWCSKYVNSQSSSDDDDEHGARTKTLHGPLIKIEDLNYRHAPSVREFSRWPELRLNNIGNLSVGKSFFDDSDMVLGTPNGSSIMNINMINNSAQLTQQASLRSNTANITTSNNTVIHPPTPMPAMITSPAPPRTQVQCNLNQIGSVHPQQRVNHGNPITIAPRGVKRRHSTYCEICNHKLTEKIEDHIQSAAHKENLEKFDWGEVSSVVEGLPSFSTLHRHRLTNISLSDDRDPEFLLLHKLDSVSQLFYSPPRPHPGRLSRRLIPIP